MLSKECLNGQLKYSGVLIGISSLQRRPLDFQLLQVKISKFDKIQAYSFDISVKDISRVKSKERDFEKSLSTFESLSVIKFFQEKKKYFGC